MRRQIIQNRGDARDYQRHAPRVHFVDAQPNLLLVLLHRRRSEVPANQTIPLINGNFVIGTAQRSES